MARSALWAGVAYEDIFNFSPVEINMIAEVAKEKSLEQYRSLAWIAYNVAALIGIAVNEPKKFPAIEEAFPTLFEEKAQQDWLVMKNRVEQFAKAKSGKKE